MSAYKKCMKCGKDVIIFQPFISAYAMVMLAASNVLQKVLINASTMVA